MLNTETPYGAVHLARRLQANPRQVLIEIAEENEGIPKEKIFDLWRNQIANDEEMARAVFWYFFINMYAQLNDHRKSHPAGNGHNPPIVSELVERARKVVLMDFVLPNGKSIADCTFAELAKYGGWLSKASKLGKPSQIVGKTITETQLRKAMG